MLFRATDPDYGPLGACIRDSFDLNVGGLHVWMLFRATDPGLRHFGPASRLHTNLLNFSVCRWMRCICHRNRSKQIIGQ